MHGPPDPEMRSPAIRQDDRGKIAIQPKQHEPYSASAETQAAFFILLPIVVLVALLALLGGSR
jgi:hypothetical protein